MTINTPHPAESWFAGGPDATTVDPAQAAKDVRWDGDMGASVGAEAYAAAQQRWNADGRELFHGYRTEVLRCAELASDVNIVAVRWRASWSPEGVVWLENVANVCGWELERFDIGDLRGELSTFSWRAVGSLLSTAVTTGQLRLPLANVEGRTELRIDPATQKVVSLTERVDLVADADGGRLLNRKVAQELAAWLDVCRRPCAVDPDEWAATVRSRCLSGVPGAGVLDVDPSEDGPAAAAVFALVAALLLGALTGALAEPLGNEPGFFGGSVCDELSATAAADGW